MAGVGGPGYFFCNPPVSDVTIESRRVLCLSLPRGLFLGNRFDSYRTTSDAKRSVSFLLYLLEAVLRSQNIACFEIVRDNSYHEVGIERVAFYRLWIFLETDERSDAFNAQAEQLVDPQSVEEASTSGGKKPRPRKRSVAAMEPPDMTYANISSVGELVKCLVQMRLSHITEELVVEFTQAGGFSDLIEGADDDEAEGDSPKSLVYRLSAVGHFEHNITKDVLTQCRAHPDDMNIDTYMKWDDDAGAYQWTASGPRRLDNFRFIDARAGSTSRWLKTADQLLTFNLPHCKPSAYELRLWLGSQASVVGVDTEDVDAMSDEELADKITTMMLEPVLFSPIPSVIAAAAVGACTWSEHRNAEVYPENQAWCTSTAANTRIVASLVASGELPEDDMNRHLANVLSDLKLLTSEEVRGWPPAYSKVRASCFRDMLEFNRVMSTNSGFEHQTLRECMFPDVESEIPAGMSPTTFYMYQFVELQRCEFGLDRPQSHMTSVIYPWAFVLLAPLFGMPGSLQARGPPGAGKGEGKKRLQPCVNDNMWFSCDSFSEQSTTFKGLPEQCFWDMDENQSQGKKEGTTLTQQTTDSNGISKRARADVDANQTKCDAVACRHVNLGSYNKALNGPMADREICVELPRSQGEHRTDMTRGAPLIALCYRILTGMSAWPWLFYMAKLFEFEETPLHVFYGLNKALNPDSKYAVHARTGEGVRILSMALSVYEIVSMYVRRKEQRLREDSTLHFLEFVRANAVLSPTAVWTAFLLITTGEDPKRDEKTLAMFKSNLRQVSGGTYQKTADDLYYQTKFVQPPGDAECPELVRASNDAGLGMAICLQAISDLMAKKCSETGHPIMKMEQEGTTSRTRYCVLMTAVSDLSVLTPTEMAIMDVLSKEVDEGNFFISEDEEQYVFKEVVRRKLLNPLPTQPMNKFGKQDVMAATEMLSSMPIKFDISPGLVIPITIVHQAQLPNSRRAAVGGPFDPDGKEGGVWLGSIPRGNVVAVHREQFDKWRKSRNGPSEAETQKTSAQRKLGSFYFLACGAPEGEKVFGGVGGADDTCAMHVVRSDSTLQSVEITNPKYTQRRGRVTRSIADATTHCGLFPMDTKTVSINVKSRLCAKINAFNSEKYGTDPELAYNYV